MNHFSTGGILFLIGTFLTLLVSIPREKAAGEEGCLVYTNIPLWPG